MNRWKFTILDRNNVEHSIDEPVGWDANTSEIKRDLDWHGIVFTNQGDTFQFHDNAMELLKTEYEQYGSQGNMTLVLEERCGKRYEEFCRGQFMFKDYEFVCGDECYVKIPIETTSEVKELRSRLNQKVNLETTVAFDETTELPTYDKLPFEMVLPSKSIILRNTALFTTEKYATPNLNEVAPGEFYPNPNPNGSFNTALFNIVPQFDEIKLSEIGNFATDANPNVQWVCGAGFIKPDDCPDVHRVVNGNWSLDGDEPRMVLFEWSQNTPLIVNINNENSFDAVSSFKLNLSFSGEISLTNVQMLAWYHIVVIRRADGTYEYLDKVKVINSPADTSGFPAPGTNWPTTTTQTFNYSNSFDAISLADGDYLFVSICGHCRFWNKWISENREAFKVKFTGGEVFAESLSLYTPTKSKVFIINEAISRIAESITNDKLRAYSEYFGRIDSQPYNHAEDGCGALEVITDGIRLRGLENRIPDKPSLFTLSLQDIFNGLNPIHNIGMGVEPDPHRINRNRLRVESWRYFYKDDVILSCTNIQKLEIKSYNKDIYSTFQFGYAKWEAEAYNGLDEFLTKITGRTSLTQIKNDLVKLSEFIASGYAIEITKRNNKFNTSDWKYDKNTFIICCKRGVDEFQFPIALTYYTYVEGKYIISLLFAGNLIVNMLSVGDSITIHGGLNDGQTYTITEISTTDLFMGAAFLLEIVVSTPFIEFGNDPSEDLMTVSIISNNIKVELGNIDNPENIIDPDTIYNYRISPIRNAMRWMNKVLASYKQFNSDAKLIFTDGDANYYAKGKMKEDGCRLENTEIAENSTINLEIFENTEDAKPFLITERIEYDYPMNSKDYKMIEANPYGLIHFSSGCTEGYGWIDTIQYKPEQGIANFKLIPKID